MRKDNYLYFVSTDGNPLDEGARQLKELGKLPRLESLELGETQAIKDNKKIHFIVPLRGDSKNSLSTTLEILTKSIKKLDTLSNKNQIISISLVKSSHIENIDFKDILTCIKRELIKRDLKIIICKRIIQYPALIQKCVHPVYSEMCFLSIKKISKN